MRALTLSASLLLAAANAISAELTGTVTDAESGAPIEGAALIVESERGVEVATATTDASGRYTVARLNAGTFLVRATARGYQRRYFGGDWVQGKAVSVGGAEPVSADIALSRAAELSGTVWRPDGTPLYPGYVWLIWKGGDKRRHFSTPTR